MKVCVTIAGSDSGGGAGIQADIKSMQANGVFAASVITAVTAQNTRAVLDAFDLPIDIIESQIDAVYDDMCVAATKTGMLSSKAIIEAVARRVQKHRITPLIVDPVMISKSGYALLRDEAVDTLKSQLFPLATLITPNAFEAQRLVGFAVRTREDAERAARVLHSLGPRWVLVKGGHLDVPGHSVDVLFDGGTFHHFQAERIETRHTHGTGDTYASAIAANLARGFELRAAVGRAKRYVTDAIRHGFAVGGGHGPTHHFYYLDGGAPFPYARDD